jgi:CheY-like chemotaxis protein
MDLSLDLQTTATVSRNTDPILIVDDDMECARMLKDMIASWDIPNPVHHLLDGDMVLQYLQICLSGGFGMQPLPSLILLDDHMPNRTGVEVLQWMHKNKLTNVRVIGVSGQQTAGLATKMRKLGAIDFIAKPATEQDYAKIKVALGIRTT